MAKSFVAQVSSIVLKNKELCDMLARESIQALTDEANKPKSKGGNMPVDTGFLRASGQISLSGMPSGPVRGRDRKDGETGELYRAPEAYAVLSGVVAGMTVFFGWTAVYARKQNLYNGFLDKAIMNWQKIVNATVRKIAKRV